MVGGGAGTQRKLIDRALSRRILFIMDEKEMHEALFRNAPDKAKKLMADHRKHKRLKARKEYKERNSGYGFGQKQD